MPASRCRASAKVIVSTLGVLYSEGAPAAAQPSGTIEIVAESGEMADTAKLSINDLPNGKVAVIGGADGPTAIYIAKTADGRPGLNPGTAAEDAAADGDEETANLARRLTASGDFTHASALAFHVYPAYYPASPRSRHGSEAGVGRRQRGVQHSAGIGMGRLSFGHGHRAAGLRYMGDRRRSRCCRTAAPVLLPGAQARRMRVVRQCAVSAQSGAAQR
ncbi:MAG: hypothetical protein ACLU5I_10570 [Alistipes finegoldii]